MSQPRRLAGGDQPSSISPLACDDLSKDSAVRSPLSREISGPIKYEILIECYRSSYSSIQLFTGNRLSCVIQWHKTVSLAHKIIFNLFLRGAHFT